LGISRGLIASAVTIAVVLSAALTGVLLVGGQAEYDDWPRPPRSGGTTVEEGGVPGESGSGGVRTAERESLGAFVGASRAARRSGARNERRERRSNRRQKAR
jgi:hypothetical protein